MVSLTVVVLLVCAFITINVEGRGNLQQACMKIRKGYTAGFRRNIKPLIIPAGQADWEMRLPGCVRESEPGGVDVMVCDDDKIPNVEFTEPDSVAVHRTGSLDSYLIVQITVYCKTVQQLQEIPPQL